LLRVRPVEVSSFVYHERATACACLPALAEMLGAGRPFRIPAWIGRLVAGEHVAVMMTQSRAGSNAKAKRELGWRPEYASWRQGFAEVVRQGSLAKAA
jgi:nucleoside-diphosphate-sugar epimerase